MSINARFKKHPLALALQVPAVSFFMLAAAVVEARSELHPGMERTIEQDHRVDDWVIGKNAHLTSNGATLKQSRVTAGKMTLNAGTTAQDIHASNGSQISLTGTTVVARSSAASAINLQGSQATIHGSSITHASGIGLSAARNFLTDEGSTVNVFNSVINGATRGAFATAFSELNFTGSEVIGTGDTSEGILLWGATANATDSHISGGENGVRLSYESADLNTSTLVLDHTSVEGRNGAALLVEGDAYGSTVADIQVRNGSTLTGGNGNILEVTGGSTANMNVDHSDLIGDVVVEEGSTAKLQLNNRASLTGQLKNVAELSVNDASRWVLVGDSNVTALKMGGGAVHFGGADEFYQLDVKSLEGNGTFVMHTDFSTHETDFLNVEGRAEGNHSLLLAATGSELASGAPIKVVHTEGGDAHFSLVGDTVDIGAYAYGLQKDGTDWLLDPTRRGTSTGAHSILALFNSAPTVLYGEMSILRTRMGELRFSEGASNGLWMRSYGNKFDVAANKNGAGYAQTQKGFTIGADAPLSGGDGQWLAGVMAGHSTSDLSLTRGSSGEVKSYYLGGYATWLDAESGLYFDGVVKLNRLHTENDVTMSDGKKAKGNYSQNAVGASAEFGRHIKLDNDFFVEPYGQLSATITQAQSYELSNGLQAKGDRSSSVVGKLGVTVGKNIQLESGGVLQPYLRTAVAHEFDQSNKVFVNDQSFNNDLSGSRIELAAGVAMSVSENVKLHADFETSQGKKIDQPWGVNFGVRYDF
ncbi:MULTISPECIES: autotransporter outer membrane beta-barrel domain-containing protein [Pseudomonas]|uniref:Autotransporter outer membrane beta-barrel domain-containing protein n=1 Tax=Pseudomonas azadiae TaxID=2843612 RepID=A0ABS6P7B4_9PSED|nr:MULTISPECIES: autotransporter outer membrane beta-barrel domain-containing protein [Pseudomonas]MBV4455897.1 autotransporter outer membrane beta-barrel domain-containing protein [Pseudomonas azadiae]NMF40361.1 autotransporter outer membrane beta-barrel domain-containing protein [Pseudomonas sp. SWRI 103]